MMLTVNILTATAMALRCCDAVRHKLHRHVFHLPSHCSCIFFVLTVEVAFCGQNVKCSNPGRVKTRFRYFT